MTAPTAQGRETRAAAVAEPLLRRRTANTELSLMVLAVLVVLCAYALVGLSQQPTLPADLLPYGGALVTLAAVAHLVTRRLAPAADPLLLPLAFVLNGLGLVMVRRIDFALEQARATPPPPLAPPQTIWTVLAITGFCLTLALVRDHRMLDRYRYLIGLGALVALLLPLLPVIGREINGARLWLRIGGLTIQPAEFAKIGLVIFLGAYLAEKRRLLAIATSRLGPFMVPPARAFGPVLVAWAASLAILVFQKDLGLSLLFFSVFVGLLYVATARFSYVVGAALLFAAGAGFAYVTFSHVASRIQIWLDVWSRYDTDGYQLAQSLFALGTGGIIGVGWGNGRPDFIPFVQTDFIFSAFGEELGLLGTTALLLCYVLIVGRGFAIALRCRDDFGTLLATGLVIMFAVQTFVIIGGVTQLIPLTGLTLPFASYGGSSLLANYILVALLLRISSTTALEERA
jgi:cell division protein FtsW (lipid II flippase)